MIFTSLNFLVFFPTVIVLYYIIPKQFRWNFLLITSLFFYINIKPIYALLLLGISLITYIFALLIEKESSDKKRERLLIGSIILIILPLFFFKYFNFVNDSIFLILENLGLSWNLPEISFLLPIGISFYTFMAIGYVIDVYNEDTRAEKNFGLITLFLSFFPLVLSGPIERAPSMLPQFKHKLDFNYQKTVNGLQLMLWGYFMKLVVADRIAIYVGQIFDHVDQHSGSTLFLATLLYPIQVYGDLGGYSLLAIGAANVMGINVRPNFNRPFFSTSMSDFWRRWHMSLITWLTDYLYTPLSFALRKYKIWGIVIALMLTFIISGIWHGAALTFVVWGTLQGIVLSIEALTKKQKNTFEKKFKFVNKAGYILFSVVITYLLFAFSLLFGGAVDTISEAFLAIEKIFTYSGPIFLNQTVLAYAFVGVSMLFLSELRDEYFPTKFLLFKNKNMYIRWFAYYSVLFIILFIGVFSRNQFIYFQF